ncbi:protein phosphatase 1 regulatory subunit 37-like [Alosa pseudoharengus]|uniref:protein phosphatase 1 regulatory subunit 37-like n=1 Tax=Alosa pseudoharengus TaxID=34774 RepID=UPI003F8AA094
MITFWRLSGDRLVASVGTRAGCLDLRGEQLDYRSCESLEDILKFIQFDSINLQETELEENGASSLLEMILYYESACQLNISSNVHMGFAGWKALAHLTRQSSCLWRLDACSMPMVEYPAQALSKALLASRLTVLHLDGASLSGRPLFTLVGTLKQNAVLQELSLAGNGLNSYQDAMQLGDLLNSNRCLRLLDLSNNLLADEGLEEICAGLTSQQSGLRSLVLLNNQITHAGMVPLANVLPDLKTLESLKLDQNQLQNEGVHILKEALMRNRSILVLGLADTQITCEGAVALAEFIAESPQIRHLDVRRNHILCGGVMAISLALRINHSLIALDLDQTRKAEKAVGGTGGNVVFKCCCCYPARLPSTPTSRCYHYVLLPPAEKWWLCAPKVRAEEGEGSSQGCALVRATPPINSGATGEAPAARAPKNKH